MRLDNSKSRSALEDIFGSKPGTAIYDLPCRIEDFCNRLAYGTLLTSDRIVNDYTLFPFYRPFLSEGTVEKVLEMMNGNTKGGGIHTTSGIMPSAVQILPFLRFCRVCVNEDREEFEEAYWHRSHQLPGIFLCHKHHIPLVESDVAVTSRQNRYLFQPLETANLSSYRKVYWSNNQDVYVYLAEAAFWLLNGRMSALGLKELRNRYLELLVRKNLATSLGIVHQADMLRSFVSFFGEELLQELGCPIKVESESNWLTKLVRKPRGGHHPLRHLLLMRYLGTCPQEFLYNDFKFSKPFGDPPFPCLNPVSTHYLQAVIPTVKITRNTTSGRPVGNFSCSCGFAYARSGPDKSEGDRFTRTRIISMGELWEKELARLTLDPSIGLREAARRLGVDPGTVKRYLNLLQQKHHRHHETMDDSLRKKYREKLLEALKNNPCSTRTQIRRIAPAVYIWLYRHEKEWLFANLPESSKLVTRPDQRVNWRNRDDEIVENAQLAIHELLLSSKPIRITRQIVGARIGCVALLQKHLRKLPKTEMLLSKAVESVEDFQIRRIRKVCDDMRSNGERISIWKVVRNACLRTGYSRKIEEEILKQLAVHHPQ